MPFSSSSRALVASLLPSVVVGLVVNPVVPEDRPVAAVNDAKSKLDDDSKSLMSNMFGGSMPSGFKMPF